MQEVNVRLKAAIHSLPTPNFLSESSNFVPETFSVFLIMLSKVFGRIFLALKASKFIPSNFVLVRQGF